jgi:hypothetical protein
MSYRIKNFLYSLQAYIHLEKVIFKVDKLCLAGYKSAAGLLAPELYKVILLDRYNKTIPHAVAKNTVYFHSFIQFPVPERHAKTIRYLCFSVSNSIHQKSERVLGMRIFLGLPDPDPPV